MVASLYAVSYLTTTQPFDTKATNYIEIFNELMVLLTGYHLVLLGLGDLSMKGREKLGISLFSIVSFMILVNQFLWIVEFILGIYMRVRRRMLKRMQ